jgi:hypothetical protein
MATDATRRSKRDDPILRALIAATFLPVSADDH